MRAVIILLLLSVTIYAQAVIHEKHMAKELGNWDLAVSGKNKSGDNKMETMHLKGKLKAEAIFGGALIKRTFKMKGRRFAAPKVQIDGLGFSFWDKQKKLMFVGDFMSDEQSFVAYFKILDENRGRPLLLPSPEVEVQAGSEFMKDGSEHSSFFVIDSDSFNFHSEMNWLRKKSKDDKFAIAHEKIEKKKESLKKYKTKNAKWILQGNYLYEEGEEKGNKYIEIVGRVIQFEVIKVRFYSDGSGKAFLPESSEYEKVKWVETELVKDFEKMK